MNWLVAVIIFVGVFTQSITGFGSGLVTMAILPGLLGIQVAAPLVSLMAITLETSLLLRYRNTLNFKAVWRLALANVIGIPLGVIAPGYVSEKFILLVLGVVLAGYAAYGLISPRLPELKRPTWAYGFGLVGGLLSGAYNTGGPPLVIYGNSQRWQPAEFKSNLQSLFLISDVMVITNHALTGHYTPIVWSYYLTALPAIGLALLIGLWLDRRIDPIAFRKIVLLLLLVMGLRLILS
jgi:uncharacterized membrane protein YfcA